MNCRRCGVPLDADRAETLLHLDIPWWDLCLSCAQAQVQPPAVAPEGPDASAFARHLSAAQGYLELGLPLDACNELEAIEPTPRRAEIPVLALRVAIYRALERWGRWPKSAGTWPPCSPGR